MDISGHQNIDFIDIDLDTDTELYIDPTLIDGLPVPWCVETKKVLDDFFENVFDCCKRKNYGGLHELVGFGKEPNETKLGQSVEQSCGKGSKPASLFRVFKSVTEQCLIEKNIVKRPSELCIFVNNFAEDRMSDLITNVIRKQLYEFTLQQCEKHNVQIAGEKHDIGKYWDTDLKKWHPLVVSPLIVDGRKILLVPKITVRKKFIVSVGQYIQKFVLTHRQAHHLEHLTKLVHPSYSKKRGHYYKPPTKRELRQIEVKGHEYKALARNFAEQNQDISDGFRTKQIAEKDIWDYVLSDEELNYYVYGRRQRIA